MVTRIPPARRPAPARPPVEVLALLAHCLQEGAEAEALDSAAAGLLQERADRLLSALTTAGLVLSTGSAELLSA